MRKLKFTQIQQVAQDGTIRNEETRLCTQESALPSLRTVRSSTSRRTGQSFRYQRSPVKQQAINEGVKPSMTYCAGIRKKLKLGEMLTTLPTPPTFHFPPCNYALIQAQVDQHRCWGHCHLILERAQNKRL